MSTPRPSVAGLPTRYRLLELRGVGATSQVWSARDVRDGRDVAVKLIAAEGAGQRLERESRALARLRGVEGVLAVHELGNSADGTAWMVCDLAVASLSQRVASTPLGPEEVLVVATRLAGALAAAHGVGVVHGDLTPANVLFDAGGAPMLADFGAADLDGLSDPVRQGITPAYAAPERLRGTPASAAADVYSLAATLRAACPQPPVPLGELLDACSVERPDRRPTAAELYGSLTRARSPQRTGFGAERRRWRRR